MASRLKHYYWLMLAVACVLCVTAIRMWDPYKEMERDPLNRVHRQMDTLRASAGIAEQMIFEYALIDTIIPLIPKTPGLYVAPAPHAIDSTAAIERLVRNQLKGAPTPHARIAVFLLDPWFGMNGPAKHFAPPKFAYLTGVDAAGPYCAIVIRMQPEHDAANRHVTGIRYTPKHVYESYQEKSNIAGPCVFWAKYGAPGSSIDSWLRNGGYQYASAPSNVLWNRWNDRVAIFGISPVEYSTSARKCLAGEETACARAIVQGRPDAREPHAIAFSSYDIDSWWPLSFDKSDRGLMAYVEQKFGATSFEKFWKSGDAVEPAFASAFGVPMSRWVHDWAHTYYGTVDAGPAIHFKDLLLSLLTLAFFMYLIVRLSQDRQVR